MILGTLAWMPNDSKRYVKGSLFSPFSGGPYAYVEINRALPTEAFHPLRPRIPGGGDHARRSSDPPSF